jgi:hypothetical protein
MNEKIKELAEAAGITFTDYGSGEFLTEDDISLPRLEKFAELILSDVLGCYHAIDNGNKVEGTEDFVKAVVKRYNLGKKK